MIKRKLITVSAIFLLLSLSFSTPSALAQALQYGPRGNLLSDGSLYYEYNGFNQLSRVREGGPSGTILEEYLYDHEGQRILKRTPTETVRYFSKHFVTTTNASGTFNTTYYYDEQNLLARREHDGATLFYHPDHLGSITLVTSEQGQPVEETVCCPPGRLIKEKSRLFSYIEHSFGNKE